MKGNQSSKSLWGLSLPFSIFLYVQAARVGKSTKDVWDWLQASHPKHETSCLKCGHGKTECPMDIKFYTKKPKGAIIRPNGDH